jgi:hypothetical protein
MCADTTNPGASHSGESAGSGSVLKTSRDAPSMLREVSAASRSASTTLAPRPMLMKWAVGFIAAKTAASNRPRVASVSGVAFTT